MNQQFRIAQATGIGNPNNASPPRIFKLTKPFTDQSVVVVLIFNFQGPGGNPQKPLKMATSIALTRRVS